MYGHDINIETCIDRLMTNYGHPLACFHRKRQEIDIGIAQVSQLEIIITENGL